MPVALYARVSTERQERQQTIDSQLAALRAWAAAQGYPVSDEQVFRDEGYSGSRLDRPGLDALRDAVRDGAVGTLVVLTPDRLARKYAYQVLLLEEFRRAGAEVVFLQHPISDDPNDQLLLQIQGAIAEYERAVLGERFRRGKLQKARDGHYITARAPYGYRYVPRRDAVPGHITVDEPEAELVRRVYNWFTDEQTTIRQVVKRLNAGPDRPRSGRPAWSPTTIHHILADPIYAGTAYANRYAYVAPAKPSIQRGPRTAAATRRCLKPREQWIAIPVPALVDQGTWDRAQAQLARNAALSFRNNTRHSYLLRCLLTCELCGLAMYGITRPASARKPARQVYRCHGKDCVVMARTSVCPSRHVNADEIEPVVWDHVMALLADPDQLLAQFDRFAAAADAGSAREQAAEQQLRARLDRTARADRRLLDAYQAGAVSLSELSERRQHLAQERRGLEQQQEDQMRLRQQQLQAEAVRTDVAAFCNRVRSRLTDATLTEKQTILQLVIDRIIVGESRLEIRHIIPLRPSSPSGNGPAPLETTRLRTDGVHPAALMPRCRRYLLQCLPKTERAIPGGQLRRDGQAARLEIDKQLAPALRAFPDAHLEAEQLLLALRRGPDQHQHAFRLRLHARLQVDAVRPDIHGAPGRQVAPLPARIVHLPLGPQPREHRRRQVRRVTAQQRPERLLNVAHRHAAQIQDGQQRIQAPRPPCPAWQDGRGEADALAASLAGSTVAQTNPLHRDRANAGLHLGVPGRGRAGPGGHARPPAARLSSQPGTSPPRLQWLGPTGGARRCAGCRSAGRRRADRADAGEQRCDCSSWRIGSLGSSARPSPASIRRPPQTVVTQFRP